MDTFNDLMHIYGFTKGDGLTARYNRAKTAERLSEERDNLDLEARITIAEYLARLVIILEGKDTTPDSEQE